MILFVKNSLEVDGRGLSPYSQAPNHDPTQRLRGNPITLNQLFCNNINIYYIRSETFIRFERFNRIECFNCITSFSVELPFNLKQFLL